MYGTIGHWTYGGNPFISYRNDYPLFCTSEANIIFNVNYN